jgi:hypothetical protein
VESLVPVSFVLFVGLIIGIWILVIRFDKARVTRYLGERGGSIQSIHLRIFGKGWMSEQRKDGGGNRIYEVEYRDDYGNLRHVWCKTAIWAGVFLTEDKIVTPAETGGRPLTAEEKVALLEDEVRRLRAREQDRR